MNGKNGGGDVTLTQCLAACGITDSRHITAERLDCAANAQMFRRFDNFNDSYNPFGAPDLRTVFLKTNNDIGGRYFAEILRDTVFKKLQDEQNGQVVAIEPRLSIYGKHR